MHPAQRPSRTQEENSGGQSINGPPIISSISSISSISAAILPICGAGALVASQTEPDRLIGFTAAASRAERAAEARFMSGVSTDAMSAFHHSVTRRPPSPAVPGRWKSSSVKIHTAQERGAAGIIIYSDSADDGFSRGLEWPEGPWRAGFQNQGGNGKYSWFWQGDPLSPGFASTHDATVMEAAILPFRYAHYGWKLMEFLDDAS
jgi:hypothetical protein